MTVTSGSYVLVDAPGSSGIKICFLTLADKGYPRRFAFDYLDDLQKEFLQLHGQQIDSVERPYKFITFGPCRPCFCPIFSGRASSSWVAEELLGGADTFIQKTKKLYMDTRANRNHLKMMSDDLKDIQGIMTKNIQEVLGRGEKLESG